MSKGLKRSLSNASPASVPIVRTISLVNRSIVVDGATGVGWGTIVIDGLPTGNISLLSAVASLTVSTSSASVTTTFDGDFSVGTSPATSASLSGAISNIIASSALGAATARVSPTVRATNATPAILNNTDSSMEVNLSLLIDDATISADDVEFLLNGFVSFAFAKLGG